MLYRYNGKTLILENETMITEDDLFVFHELALIHCIYYLNNCVNVFSKLAHTYNFSSYQVIEYVF